MSLAIAKGYQSVVGWKRNPNQWGCGGATPVGALNGIEPDKESLVINSELIENVAVSGKATQLPGVKGTELHSGNIGPMPFYYQGCEDLIAQVFGSESGPVSASAAYSIVAAVLPSDASLTLVHTVLTNLSGKGPAPLTFTLVHTSDTITAMVITVVGLDGAGNAQTKVYTNQVLSAGPLVYTTPDYWSSLTSITISGLTGTATGSTIAVTATINVYKNVFQIADSVDTLSGTLVATSSVRNREWPYVKLSGVTIDFDPKNLGKLTFEAIPYSLNLLDVAGVQSAVNVVAAVLPAAGALTLASTTPIAFGSTGTTPASNLYYVYTDGGDALTELIVTVVGTNADGDVITEVYQLSTILPLVSGKAVLVGVKFFATLISATVSGIAGTPSASTISLGWQNGVNNSTQVAAVTLPSTGRQFVTFPQATVMIKDITDVSDFTPAQGCNFNDEVAVSKISIKIERNQKKDLVTSRTKKYAEDPIEDNFIMVSGTLDFARWENTTQNEKALEANLSKALKNMKIIFSGPLIGAVEGRPTGYPYLVTLYFTNLQFTKGSPNITGPGPLPLTMEFKTKRSLTVPANFPGGYDYPITMELTNQRSTTILS